MSSTTGKSNQTESKKTALASGTADKILGEGYSLTKELRGILEICHGVLSVNFDATGAINSLEITDRQGNPQVQRSHMSQISGQRRLAADYVKEVEKYSSGLKKVNMGLWFTSGGASLQKVRLTADSNARLGELIRFAEQIEKHYKTLQFLDGEFDEDRVLKEFLLEKIVEVVNCLEAEARYILKGNVSDKEYRDKALFEAGIPKYLFDRFTGPDNFQGIYPGEYLFPSGVKGGITLTTKEIADDEFLKKQEILLVNNKEFYLAVRGATTNNPEPKGYDSSRVYKETVAEFKWIIPPSYLSPKEKVLKFLNSKYVTFEADKNRKYPEGEAGQYLKKLLPKFDQINFGLNRMYRMIAYDQDIGGQFWKLHVNDADILNSWMSEDNPKFREVVKRDIDKVTIRAVSTVFEMYAEYCAMLAGIWNPQDKKEFVDKIMNGEIMNDEATIKTHLEKLYPDVAEKKKEYDTKVEGITKRTVTEKGNQKQIETAEALIDDLGPVPKIPTYTAGMRIPYTQDTDKDFWDVTMTTLEANVGSVVYVEEISIGFLSKKVPSKKIQEEYRRVFTLRRTEGDKKEDRNKVRTRLSEYAEKQIELISKFENGEELSRRVRGWLSSYVGVDVKIIDHLATTMYEALLEPAELLAELKAEEI